MNFKNLFKIKLPDANEKQSDSTLDALNINPKILVEDMKKKNENIKENENSDKPKVQAVHSIDEIKEEVIKVLKTCFDPEIPTNIYDLGLIYDIKVATNGDVLIVMTLTSPMCPVAGSLPGEVEQKVKNHPMVHDAKVQLTFDPPWNKDMMSDTAKYELGFL